MGPEPIFYVRDLSHEREFKKGKMTCELYSLANFPSIFKLNNIRIKHGLIVFENNNFNVHKINGEKSVAEVHGQILKAIQ